MRTLFLHIGMPKTGSSSIQKSLRAFDNGTTRYLDYGSPNHSKIALFLFRRTEDLLKVTAYPWFESSKKIDVQRQQIKQAVEAIYEIPRDVDIFSAEVMYYFSQDDFNRALSFFKGFFDRIKVVIYLRAPHEFCESSFQQRVKSGWTTLDIASPRYQAKMSKLVSQDMIDTVIARKFSKPDLVDGNCVSDAMQIFGVSRDENSVLPRENTSLSANAVALLFSLNRAIATDTSGTFSIPRPDVIKFMRQIPGDKLRLSKSVTDNACNEAEITWVRENFGVDLSHQSADLSSETCISSEKDLLDLADEAASCVEETFDSPISRAILQTLKR